MISVIIPTYNNSKFIVEAIEGVLGQTYTNYEIIVVDDGSTDNTKDSLKPYYGIIRYFYKDNGGVASARNLGIRNAQGDYIAFLDSDDLWASEKLSAVSKVIKSYPQIGLIYSDTYQIDEIGRVVGIFKAKSFGNKSYEQLLFDNFIPASSVVVKRKCFETCGLFFENFETPAGAEDWDLWIRVAKKYDIKHINKPLISYRIHSANTSKANYLKLNRDILLVLKRALENEYSLKGKIRKNIYSNAFYTRGRKYLAALAPKEARKELYQSLRLYPFQYKAYILILISFLGRRLLGILRQFHLKIKLFRIFHF